MKTVKIYLITNCFNDPNKVYIGKTKNCRKNDHKITYGNQIEYTIIDEINSLNRKYWEPLESYWIEQFRQWGFELMNIRKKGGSGCDFHTDETRNKMKGILKPTSGGKGIPKPTSGGKGIPKPGTSEKLKGIPFDEERILKQKIGHLNKDKSFYKSNNWLKNLKKIVLQYDLNENFIKEWPSIREASNMLKIHESGISQNLNKKQKTAGGFIWKFKN
jgi:hypothetical protein